MPDSFEELFDRASRALAAGWAEQALVPATEAVKLQPQRADARVLLARAWIGMAGYPRAISDARAALDLGPAPAVAAAAQVVIGRASMHTNDAAAAEASLREARALAATPLGCALLCAVLVDAGRAADAAAIAREDAQRDAGKEETPWNATRIGFESLANAIDRASGTRARSGSEEGGTPPERIDRASGTQEPIDGGDPAEIALALGDLLWDAGLPEDAKPRYHEALAKKPSLERAADGLRALAAGEKVRPRPKVKAAPRRNRGGVRWARLAGSGASGAIAIYVLFRWEELAPLGVLRAAIVVAGLGVVLVLVAVARREELAALRAVEVGARAERVATADGGGDAKPQGGTGS